MLAFTIIFKFGALGPQAPRGNKEIGVELPLSVYNTIKGRVCQPFLLAFLYIFFQPLNTCSAVSLPSQSPKQQVSNKPSAPP